MVAVRGQGVDPCAAKRSGRLFSASQPSSTCALPLCVHTALHFFSKRKKKTQMEKALYTRVGSCKWRLARRARVVLVCLHDPKDPLQRRPQPQPHALRHTKGSVLLAFRACVSWRLLVSPPTHEWSVVVFTWPRLATAGVVGEQMIMERIGFWPLLLTIKYISYLQDRSVIGLRAPRDRVSPVRMILYQIAGWGGCRVDVY